jgi:5-hydroxyisourate hydrolase-like protein (transthyretin family)
MNAIVHFKITARRAVHGLLLVALPALGPTDAAGRAPPPPERPTQAVQVAGTCRDETGQPLAGVTVTLYREDANATKTVKVGAQETGADGRFVFPDAPAPTADRILGIAFTKAGRGSTVQNLYPQSIEKPLEVEVRPAATLQGRVTDEAGQPVAGARVWSHSLRTGPLDGISSAVTGADGKYAITDMGRLTDEDARAKRMGGVSFFFDVLHPDFARERPTWTRMPATGDVVLHPGGVIEGKVTDRVTGKPAAGVAVSLQGIRLGTWDQVRTDVDGKYQIRSLKAGRYNLWADAADRACTAIDSLTVTAGNTLTGQELTLVEGGWVEGRVVDATTGAPITGTADRPLYVACHGPGRPKSGAAVQSARVDEKGRFRLRVAPGLTYPYIMTPDLWSRTEGKADFQAGIEVKAGEATTVVFRTTPTKPR